MKPLYSVISRILTMDTLRYGCFLWIRSLIHFLDCYCYGLHGISCHIGPCYHGTELYDDVTVQWCHNERDDISNHQPQDCLLQAQIEENIKAPHHWPLWGEFIGDRWIPHTKASNPENVFIQWRHHEELRKCLYLKKDLLILPRVPYKL